MAETMAEILSPLFLPFVRQKYLSAWQKTNTAAKLLHVMLKRPLNLFTAENNSESVDVLTHSNTGTPGTVTCLPVAAVECLKLKR